MKYSVQYHYQKSGSGIKLHEGHVQIDIDSEVESEIVEAARQQAMDKENVRSVKVGSITPL